MSPASTSNIFKNVCVLACAAALLTSGTGCLWKNKANKSGTQPMSNNQAGDDQFERGSNRPPTPRTLYTLARMLQTQGKDDQADPILRKIITSDPKFMPAYCDLAELQMRQRRIEDAYRTLSVGLKISPSDPILINNRGMCLLLLHEYDAALADFVRATALAPDNARYRSNMAVALAMLGRDDESRSLYALVMPSSDAQFNLDVLRQARGDAKAPAEIQKRVTSAIVAPVAPAEIQKPITSEVVAPVAPAQIQKPVTSTVVAPVAPASSAPELDDAEEQIISTVVIPVAPASSAPELDDAEEQPQEQLDTQADPQTDSNEG